MEYANAQCTTVQELAPVWRIALNVKAVGRGHPNTLLPKATAQPVAMVFLRSNIN